MGLYKFVNFTASSTRGDRSWSSIWTSSCMSYHQSRTDGTTLCIRIVVWVCISSKSH